MTKLEELIKQKERVEIELEKQPHQRDGRLFRYHTEKERLKLLEEKIARKKNQKNKKERKREARRKIIMGAAFKGVIISVTGMTFYEYLEAKSPIWFEEFSGREGHRERLAKLGYLVMRDIDQGTKRDILDAFLKENASERELFSELF